MPKTKEARAAYRLSPAERKRGLALVKLAALILFTFPGSPTVYYGDEAAMEGWEDPFNRGTYPWGQENMDLKAHFTRLGTQRRLRPSLQKGTIQYLYSRESLLAYARQLDDERCVTVVNASGKKATLSLPWNGQEAADLLSSAVFPAENGVLTLTLPPYGGFLLV